MKSAISILENICFPGKDPALTYDAVVVGADKMLSSLCRTALENSLAGLEFAYGIPGTVGGAVYMNAGAYGGEMKDVLVSVRYLTAEGESVEVPAEQLDLSSRHSIFEENGGCILSAKFHLARGNAADIRARMDDLMARRKDKQPLDKPSAGSTFKRPVGAFAAGPPRPQRIPSSTSAVCGATAMAAQPSVTSTAALWSIWVERPVQMCWLCAMRCVPS